MQPIRVQAHHLTPGQEVHRLDTGERIYTIEAVGTEQVFNPEEGMTLTYVRAECRHHRDGSLRPHYWLPLDWVTVHTP